MSSSLFVSFAISLAFCAMHGRTNSSFHSASPSLLSSSSSSTSTSFVYFISFCFSSPSKYCALHSFLFLFHNSVSLFVFLFVSICLAHAECKRDSAQRWAHIVHINHCALCNLQSIVSYLRCYQVWAFWQILNTLMDMARNAFFLFFALFPPAENWNMNSAFPNVWNEWPNVYDLFTRLMCGPIEWRWQIDSIQLLEVKKTSSVISSSYKNFYTFNFWLCFFFEIFHSFFSFVHSILDVFLCLFDMNCFLSINSQINGFFFDFVIVASL